MSLVAAPRQERRTDADCPTRAGYRRAIVAAPLASIRPSSLCTGRPASSPRWPLPAAATLLLSAFFLADSPFTRTLLAINWPAWLSAVEHFGSEWANRVLPAAALLVALLLDRAALRWLIAALPLQAVVVHALKFAVGRVRPADACDSNFFDPFSPIHDGWPSGHAALAWTIAIVFARRGSHTTLLWAVAAMYVCWARLHTFAHLPSDLLAGAIAGWLATEAAALALPRWIDPSAAADGRPASARRPRAAALWLAALLAPPAVALALGRTVSPVDQAAARAEITNLYARYLDRSPDEPGLAAYAAQRVAGLPLVAIARDILDSDESRARLAPLTTEQRLREVYRLLLDREPTAAETARDAPLVADLTRRRGRLTLLLMRLTWGRTPR